MSQQGKEYTDEQISAIFAKLEPWLKLGLSLHKAVNQHNDILEKTRLTDKTITEEPIAYRTIARYVNKNKNLAEKVEAWKSHLEILSRNALYKELNKDDPDLNIAKWWLEKRVSDEFGNKISADIKGEVDTGSKEVAEALRAIIESDE